MAGADVVVLSVLETGILHEDHFGPILQHQFLSGSPEAVVSLLG